MKTTLEIALVQSHLAWENPVQNRASFTKKIASTPTETDVIVLPEMFTTGFTMQPDGQAESMEGITVQWMQTMASTQQAAICGSMIIEEGRKYYNRFLFITPDGNVQWYDKHHLFSLAKEERVFTAGSTEVLIEYKGWKIKPQICYDLRFPVWARNTAMYDVLLYVASWPTSRIHAWDTLLSARAIENLSYCVGVNRIGMDGKGYTYNGHSAVYNALGHAITHTPMEKETIVYATLGAAHIQQTREQLPFLADANAFSIL